MSVFGRIWPDLAGSAAHSDLSVMPQRLFVKELTSTGVRVQDVNGVFFFAGSIRLEPFDFMDEL